MYGSRCKLPAVNAAVYRWTALSTRTMADLKKMFFLIRRLFRSSRSYCLSEYVWTGSAAVIDMSLQGYRLPPGAAVRKTPSTSRIRNSNPNSLYYLYRGRLVLSCLTCRNCTQFILPKHFWNLRSGYMNILQYVSVVPCKDNAALTLYAIHYCITTSICLVINRLASK